MIDPLNRISPETLRFIGVTDDKPARNAKARDYIERAERKRADKRSVYFIAAMAVTLVILEVVQR